MESVPRPWLRLGILLSLLALVLLPSADGYQVSFCLSCYPFFPRFQLQGTDSQGQGRGVCKESLQLWIWAVEWA